VPDYPFTNELGKVTRLSDFRGKVVGLTFMFTRCPLPEFCPRMLRNFETAQETLKGQNAFTNWHLVALTIDPKFDTPAALRAHGQTYGYDPERWTFLTGALIDIDAIAEQAGILYRRQTPDALPDHNLRTLVIDAEGRLRKTFIGNTWKPEELVEEMQAALAPFEDAPEKETFE
jgi:protein SCO1/2